MTPTLRTFGSVEHPRAVVLLLHGGQESSHARVHSLRPAYLRMLPFALDLRRALRGKHVAVWLLRYRVRGWNAPHRDPVRDAEWALARIRAEHGDIPVVIVGHSMGGRTALRVGGDPSVVGVAALAPWIKPTEPVDHLAGRAVLIAHGLLDTLTDPEMSYLFATRAKAVTDRVAHFDVHDENHAMLRKPRTWSRLVTGFVTTLLDTQPPDPLITNALGQPSPEGLRIPL